MATENLSDLPARVTVLVVTWNSAAHLGATLEALLVQTYQSFGLRVVDNASSDATRAVVVQRFPAADLTVNAENRGFCAAVNQGLRQIATDYVLLLNPDAVMAPDCLEQLVRFAEAHPAAASFAPKLVRSPLGDQAQGSPDATIVTLDAAGLQLSRSRSGTNRGEGELDVGQYARPEQVFGCPAACGLYRRTAFDVSAVAGEYWDENFFAYKDDIDVAWRLRLYGFEAWYVPGAIATHARAVRQAGGSWWRRAAGRSAVPPRLRALSVKNHYLTILKNEQRQNFLRDFVFIIGHSLAVLGLSLTVEPFLWRALPPLLRQLPSTWRKRRIIQAQAQVKPAEMRQWFTR